MTKITFQLKSQQQQFNHHITYVVIDPILIQEERQVGKLMSIFLRRKHTPIFGLTHHRSHIIPQILSEIKK